MIWPRTPVERVQDFRPRFCPWRDCRWHLEPDRRLWFRLHGSYRSRRGRVIPRFRCRTCGRTFSQQSFAFTFYLKRPELVRPIAAGLMAGSAHRQLARTLGCAASTVTRLSARLGRHALLLHARALAGMRGGLPEPVVLDHFEVFEFTQDYPFGVATVVGARSWFWYLLDPAPHGRSGRMSELQRRRLEARPPRPRLGGYLGSSRRVMEHLARLAPEDRRFEIRADDHEAYRRAARCHGSRLLMRCFRNPPRGPRGSPRTAEAVARDEALFPVDALHQLLRHTGAHYRRETIAFGRRGNAIMERLFLTAVWRNFVKPLLENHPERGTAAMHLGLAREPWRWRRVFARRLFPGREDLPAFWQMLYRRGWTTPTLSANTVHNLTQAY
jgi:hypothetical protein